VDSLFSLAFHRHDTTISEQQGNACYPTLVTDTEPEVENILLWSRGIRVRLTANLPLQELKHEPERGSLFDKIFSYRIFA